MCRHMLIVSCIALLLSGCGDTAPSNKGSTMVPHEIEQIAHIRFPASAQQIYTHSEAGMDRLTLLRFEIDAQDLQPFLQESNVTSPLEEGYRPIVTNYGKNLAWWDIDRPQRVAGTVDRAAGVYREIMADLTAPEKVIIYMVVMD